MRCLSPLATLVLAALPAGGQSFYSAEELRPRIAGSEQLAVADLNRDGEPDLVFSSTAESPVYDQVAFQLNLGGGVYGPAVVIEPEMFQIGSLEVADVNMDGFPDVVAGSSNQSDAVGMRLYLGDGTGFSESQRWTNFSTSSIAFADMDGDTDPDLVYQHRTRHPYTDSIKWRPNNGSGVFGSERTVANTAFSRPIVVRDFDGDMDMDVAAMQGTSNQIVWFANNGSGSFGGQRTIQTGFSNMDMMDAADMDRDGDVDVVLFRYRSAYIFLNNGRGVFTRRQIFTPDYADNLELADFDKDGAADIIFEQNTSIRFRRNLGNAQFAGEELLSHPDYQSPADMETADIDGDGWLDIVATEFGGATIYHLRNAIAAPPRIVSFEVDDNTVPAGTTVTLEWEVENATEVRIDGISRSGTSLQVRAGSEDTVFTLRASNQFGLVEQEATVFVPGAIFGSEQLVGSGRLDSIQHLDAGDLTGNGFVDIVFASRDTDDLGWFRNNGSGGFTGPHYLHQDLERVTGPLVFDVDGDGALDVVAASERHPLVWFRNNRSGSFGPAIEIGDMTGWLVKALDMNGDELPDLVVQDVSFSPAKGALGDGAGNFAAPVELGLGRGRDFEVHDWTGDGLVDLLWVYSNTATLFPAEGVLSYPWQSGSSVGGTFSGGRTIELFDFTGDGILDFIVGESSNRYVDLVHGKGSGVFDREYSIADVRDLIDTETADFDLDGDLDVAFYTRRSSQNPASVVWIENDGAGNFSEPQMATNTIPEGTPLLSVDMDNDVDLDLVVAADEDTIHWIPNLTNLRAPGVAAESGLITVDEGSAVQHTGSFVDSAEDIVTVACDVGQVSQVGSSEGTWTWVHPPIPDGPASITVKVTATDSFGAERSVEFLVQVVNVDPVVTLERVADIREGESAELRITVTDVGAEDKFTIKVDWGDPLLPNNLQTVGLNGGPAGSYDLGLRKFYPDDNPSGTARDHYTILVEVSDDDGGRGEDSTSFLVSNVRPKLVLEPVAVVGEGEAATLIGTIEDPGKDQHTLFIDWGDPASPGNFEEVEMGTIRRSPERFLRTHHYPDDNPGGTPEDGRLITVLAIDDEGASAFATVPVVVRNSAPVLSRLDAIPGENSMTLDIGIEDPGVPDSHTVLINWGDGSAQTVKLPAGQRSLQPMHSYPPGGAEPGSHTVMVTVTDDDTESVMGVVGPPPAPGSPGGIDKIEMLEGGEIRIGFSAAHGEEFVIEYSGDLETWQAVVPNVVVAGNRMLWTDTGPPATESHPSSVVQRYYRFRKVTAE